MELVFCEGNQVAIAMNEAEGQQNQQRSLFLVPGYRFYPSDYELMKFYLIPKMHGHQLRPGIIREDILNVYQCQPADIPGIQEGGDFVYFFTNRDRKYENGKRPDRCTKDQKGCWKSISKISEIYDEKDEKKVLLGYKNTLVYFLKDLTDKNKKKQQQAKEGNKGEEGIKTNWIMHEYIAAKTQANASKRKSMMLDEVVLCRIYNRTRQTRTRTKEESCPNQINKCDGGSSENHISPAPVEANHQQAPIQQFKKARLQQFANNPTTPTTFSADAWLISQQQLFGVQNLQLPPPMQLSMYRGNDPSLTYQLNQGYFGQEQKFVRPEETNEQACNIASTGQPQAFGVPDVPPLLPDVFMQPYCLDHYTNNNLSSFFDGCFTDLDEMCKEHGFAFAAEHHKDLQVDIHDESNQLPNDESSTGCATHSAPPDMSGDRNQS